MPVHIKKRAGKYRIVDDSTDKITREPSGTPVDGGGHQYEQEAYRQSQAINKSMKKVDRKLEKQGKKARYE